jgi:hypothetical protein
MAAPFDFYNKTAWNAKEKPQLLRKPRTRSPGKIMISAFWDTE